MSKHRIKGTHSLKYDSIFKGKKDDVKPEDNCYLSEANQNQSYDIDNSSFLYDEKENPYEYNRLKDLKDDVYNVIVDKLDMNLNIIRRKPQRDKFNDNFRIIVETLDMNKYSLSDVFVEFSYYFSDNLTSMFKLLNSSWRGKITDYLIKKSNNKMIKDLDKINFM